MKVLYQTIQAHHALTGGAQVRMEYMAKELSRGKIRVTIGSGARNSAGFDLVHLWGYDHPDIYAAADRAVAAGVPYIVSPIFIDYDSDGFFVSPSGRAKLIRTVLGDRLGYRTFKFWTSRRVRETAAGKRNRRLFDQAALVLPTSGDEAKRLTATYRFRTPVRAVQGGLNPEMYRNAPEGAFTKRYGFRDFATTVGRIEPHKNQLSVIRALQGTRLPYVCVGRVIDRGYFRECQRLAKELGVAFHQVGPLPPSEIPAVYADARVHVLASWSETFGQVTFQAVLAGCPVVHTKESPWQEYFGDRVPICNPADPGDIREAIEDSLGTTPSEREKLARYITKNFNWTVSARQLAAAYREAKRKTR